MPVSLLSTKFYVPPRRPDAVSRPRLSQKLLAGANQPRNLTLLSGPAGSGKTTLLSEFVGQLRQPVAWLSIDEEDNSPNRFWTYLIAACQSVLDGVGESAMGLLQAAQPLPDDAIPSLLINDLTGQDRAVVLLLDDYHAIQNPSIHAGVRFLLDHMPGSLHIVVSTRVDPPWPLARYRARNQLVEIRAQDLRFSVEETAEFLNRSMGLDLAAEDIATLEARTEGWIAGLQLAALSIQGRGDVAAFIQAFAGSHVYVAEYLVEEVLQRQPADVRAFLMQTSILERMCAGLCDGVTGRQDGQAMLTSLHRTNLFVNALDDVGQWYRYHRLFADLLQARLGQVLPADTVAALHTRAGTWYEQNGFPAEAVNHLLSAHDFEGAARLIEQHAYPMMIRGELTTLMRWIEDLPEEVVQHRPLILIAKAWALVLAGAVRQVEPVLQQVEALASAGDRTPETEELLGNAAAMRAFFAMMAGDYPRALDLAQRAAALVPESKVQVRWLLPYTLGAAHRGQGQYEEAAEAFARQVRIGEMHDDLIVWATGVTEVAIVQRAQGRLREAAETCHRALQRMAEQGAARFGSLAKIEVPLIEVLREQNELTEARRRVDDVIARMQGWPMPTDRLFAYLALIHVQEAQGDLGSAFETLRMAQELTATRPVLANLARAVNLVEIQLSLAMGELAAARRQMHALQPGTGSTVTLREQELMMLARLRLAQGRADEAAEILAPLAGDAEAGGRQAPLIELLALQARALDERGDKDGALAVLRKALALAQPEGFVRVFVGEGEAMRHLLEAVAQQFTSASGRSSIDLEGYVDELLASLGDGPFPDLTPPTPDRQAGLIEPLTPREMEVLRLIATGDSNRTIAEKLVITVSAVKKHAGNIYGKLNVNSRTQAVARAREIGLLGGPG
jgi:LuxR family maltose regulon positive regulatory protein